MVKKTATVVITLLSLMALPEGAKAGPIGFQLSGNLSVEPGHAAVAEGLSLSLPTGDLAYTPGTMPLSLSLLSITPPVLPSDPPNAPNQGGGTYYDSAYLSVSLFVTDLASGQQGDVTLSGRAHMEWGYAGNGQWLGAGYTWFEAQPQSLMLGGQQYTLWIPDWDISSSPHVDVWIGPNPPVDLVPEPGTLALAGIGLLPIILISRHCRSIQKPTIV